MKKIIGIASMALLLAVILFSCKKDKEEGSLLQEVTFQANQITPDGGLKSTNAFDVECSVIEPTHAHVVIEGVNYDPQVFRIDGKLYTQAIKLTPGAYTVTQFFLYKDSGPAGYDALDEIVMATPEAGSPYAVYTDPNLDFDFTVSAFTKTQVPIQVLCFKPNVYTEFGFNWFSIGEVVLREACFFGDICLNGEPYVPADFNGSLYGINVGVDVPAIMKIIVKRGDVEVPNSPFQNVGALTSPLCVQYPDYVGQVDNFTFELQLWLPDGNGFSYQTYATYTATDAGALSTSPGADGVLDFAVGTCGYGGDADQTFDFLYVPHFELTVPSAANIANQNGNKPWYTSEINGLCIEFTLHNPTSVTAYWDFQIDGDPGVYSPAYSDILITEGPLAGTLVGNFFSGKSVGAGQTAVITKCGTSEIKVAIHFGGEQLWYLDWATFTAN